VATTAVKAYARWRGGITHAVSLDAVLYFKIFFIKMIEDEHTSR
jgi:hypothetical protein